MYRITILILAIVLFTSCKKTATQENNATEPTQKYLTLTPAQVNSGNIKLEKIATNDFQGSVQVTGKIQVSSAQQSAVSTLMPGIMKNLTVIEGQQVQKGQILFYVESQDFISLQQDLATLNEKLVYLKNDYERQTALFKENANTEKKYMEAASEYKSSLATFNGTKKKLQLLGINIEQVLSGNLYMSLPVYAPISGSIKMINGMNGAYINTSDSVLEIVNLNNPILTLQVFESQLNALKVNQNIDFTTSYGKTYQAKIVNIGSAIDPNTKTVQIVAAIANGNGLLDGLQVNANIITHATNAKSISYKAVISEDNKDFVYVLHHKDKDFYYFEKTPIVITAKNDNWVAIENANPIENKEIITEGANMLDF